jgi:hypothetical protein
VVAESDGVTKLDEVAPVLVCNTVPPVAAVHHLNTPLDALVAFSVTVPVPQRDAAVADGAAGAAPVVTVAVTAVRELVQVPLPNCA